MKITFLLAIQLLIYTAVVAQTIQSVQNGNWHVASTWQGGVIPTATHDIVIRHAVTFDGLAPNTTAFAKSITINNGLNVTAELLITGGTVTVGTGGVTISGLPATGNNVQFRMQGTSSLTTTSFFSVTNQMPGNFVPKVILEGNAQLTVNTFSYSYTPTDNVAETQDEVTLADNAKLKVNFNVNFIYSTNTKKSQLEFYADDASSIDVVNNFSTTIDFIETSTADGIRFALGTQSVGSTATLKIGNFFYLTTNGGEDPEIANTKNSFTMSDFTTAEIGNIQLFYIGEFEVPSINQLRVMASSYLLIKTSLSCINQSAFSEYNNSFYMTGTSTVELQGTAGGFGVGGAGVLDINTDSDITTFMYAGNVEQQLVTPLEWYENLTINNTSGTPLTLAGEISVQRQLTMQNGILETGGYDNFIMRMTASANEGNAQSYITGGLVKRGATNSFFPIGNNNVWAPIHINTNGNGNANTRFEIDYTHTPHPTTLTDGSVNHISEVEYWTLRLVPHNGALSVPNNATPTFYYKNACTSDITNTNTTPSQDLIIARKGTSLTTWSGIQASTINTGSEPCGVGAAQGSLSVSLNNNVQQYGEFTFGFLDTPMPVTWVDFAANLKNNFVELKWQTATEVNADYFEIQKSADGNKWQTIGQVKATGFSNTLQTYFFIDHEVCQKCYYRLVQTDTNGEFSYSSVVKILQGDDAGYYIAPNPLNLSKQRIIQVNPTLNIRELQFLDISGKMVFAKKAENNNLIVIEENLPKGIYNVKLYGENGLIVNVIRLLVVD
ncbi:MAG: T9SS type A sorting domain-containing protein [Chryseotalea sp.]|jgi:hypothetical protein